VPVVDQTAAPLVQNYLCLRFRRLGKLLVTHLAKKGGRRHFPAPTLADRIAAQLGRFDEPWRSRFAGLVVPADSDHVTVGT
jgi:hypothetical protein